MKLWKYSGIFFMIIGAIHSLVGIILGWDSVLAIAAGGFFNSVELFNGVFWFLFAGFALIFFGCLLHWIIKSTNAPLPPFVGWCLLATGVICVFLMPVSGFWWFILQGVIILSNRR